MSSAPAPQLPMPARPVHPAQASPTLAAPAPEPEVRSALDLRHLVLGCFLYESNAVNTSSACPIQHLSQWQRVWECQQAMPTPQQQQEPPTQAPQPEAAQPEPEPEAQAEQQPTWTAAAEPEAASQPEPEPEVCSPIPFTSAKVSF